MPYRRIGVFCLYSAVVLAIASASLFAQTLPVPPHADYPRPSLVRELWLSLNGAWELAILPSRAAPANRFASDESSLVSLADATFAHRILVPFPIESSLSGVTRAADRFVYRRTFVIPPTWNAADRILLHFGAVDWEATVFVNGQRLGQHRGGYDSFSFDITDSLAPAGETNRLEVVVFDPTETGGQPCGRQSRVAGETLYTPSSGIWQSVWIEPVPTMSVRRVRYTTDRAAQAITFTVETTPLEPGVSIDIEILRDGQVIGRGSGGTGSGGTGTGGAGPIRVVLDADVKPWSPESPHMDATTISIVDGTRSLDRVSSYVAFRDLALAEDAQGRTRLTLNGRPVFWQGVVDQGMWRDGLYTPPSDEAMRRDILTAKRLGFNLIRKYDKVESERWYYWCDRIGMAVWQDIPSGQSATPEAQANFERELRVLLAERAHHPSLVVWSLFREGIGQFQTNALTDLVRTLDPTRFVCAASGWNDTGAGDLTTSHRLPQPLTPTRTRGRASVIALYGGLTFEVAGHSRSRPGVGFGAVFDQTAFLERYTAIQRDVATLRADHGIDAAIFHQLTDVETDCNGLQTYDRAVVKIPFPHEVSP